MDQEVKNISSDAEKKPEQVAKYTAKDSVFTSLFREPKYLLQLYQALHPEDHEATEDSIKNVTITNVLLDQYYNDVGFQIGEKIVILVEQQSSWSINIVVRCLLYLAQTYQEYFESTKQNVYGTGTSKTGDVRHFHRKQEDEAGVSVSVKGVFWRG
jgi:hypothetical protein